MTQLQNILIKNPVAVMTGLRGPRARAGNVDIRIVNGRIAEMATGLVAQPGERVIDARNSVVYPGWINTHHHLFQNLLKAVPEGLNQDLQGWLASVPYPRLNRFTPQLTRIAARLGMAELLLSGVTTCADHHYLYHAHGSTESGDTLFDTADEFGLRFVLCRGGALESASAHPGFSKTALQPETLEQMVGDIERLKSRYHQDTPDAMRRVVVAPTTPTFSLPPTLLRELAHTARGSIYACTRTCRRRKTTSTSAAKNTTACRWNSSPNTNGSAPTSGSPTPCICNPAKSACSRKPAPAFPIAL